MLKRTLMLLSLILFNLPSVSAKSLNDYHRQAGLDCSDCHEQGRKFIPAKAQCLGCHGPMKELIEATKQPVSELYSETNPHNSHHYGDGLECSACHSEHESGKIYCNICHHNFEYPNFPGREN